MTKVRRRDDHVCPNISHNELDSFLRGIKIDRAKGTSRLEDCKLSDIESR
jgi:hypothetical protein